MVKILKKKVVSKIAKSTKTKTKPKVKGPVKNTKIKINKKVPKKVLVKVVKKVVTKKSKKIGKVPLGKESSRATLQRSLQNPIIKPRLYSWESKATLNPTAFFSNGKIHILYRAIGHDDVSVLGYASSYDGYHIQERPTYHAYKRPFLTSKIGRKISYTSGGGWSGGCEDPKITLIGDTLYMLYTAFDGWSSVRIAMTSISLENFKKHRWSLWEKPVLISPPGVLNKNWGFFPEKINGKFALIHGIAPKILVNYFDTLDVFDGNFFIESVSHHDRERAIDETGIRSMGPVPIRTRLGWLVLYHVTEPHDRSRYKLFAMILDIKDPTKILYRSPGPVLSPDENYENEGHKAGIVYSCGAVIKDARLFVYYGGADTVTCVASIPLEELLSSLEKHQNIKLKNNKTIKLPPIKEKL
ncbi:MAG: hypothetical protein M3Q34_02575 [bacterium]|nr:hypothetical protein [bacterium]